MQSHASTSVRMLKITNICSHATVRTHKYCIHSLAGMGSATLAAATVDSTAIPLFGHTKILHSQVEMGNAALAAAVPYSGKAT